MRLFMFAILARHVEHLFVGGACETRGGGRSAEYDPVLRAREDALFETVQRDGVQQRVVEH